MSENSGIEWTDTTWNPVTGCSKVSPGCAHCYAETFAERFRGVHGHPFEQGFDLKLWPERLALPLKWKRPRRVFVNSMSDLFHEDVPFEFVDQVFAVMALTRRHTYQVLTKRPERMREYLTSARELDLREWPLPNVWFGTSVENQRWADIRIPELLATPAAVRFVSYEPALGPVDFTAIRVGEALINALTGFQPVFEKLPAKSRLDWIIVGGESGPKARPFNLAWARSTVAQCKAAGVAVFVKQLGADPRIPLEDFLERPVRPGERWLKSRKGGEMAEWPADLRVREFPSRAEGAL